MANRRTDSVSLNQPRTDSLRLMKLINQPLRADSIVLSPDVVQRICDSIMGARPDFLPLVDVSGVIHFATDACESLFGISAPPPENKPFASALQATNQQTNRTLASF